MARLGEVRRASKGKVAKTKASVARIVRRPSSAVDDFEGRVQRAVAAALEAHGITCSGGEGEVRTGPNVVVVTARDIPEGFAATFLSKFGVRHCVALFTLIPSFLCHSLCHRRAVLP